MMVLHKQLAASGRWLQLSLIEQLANVGTDIERAMQWKKRGEVRDNQMAFERALDMTIADPKNRKRLKELLRVREALIDYFLYYNEYATDDEFWQSYFYNFNYAAAVARGK
jgi:hypothetical protein